MLVAKTDLPEFLESLSDIDAERVARQAYMKIINNFFSLQNVRVLYFYC